MRMDKHASSIFDAYLGMENISKNELKKRKGYKTYAPKFIKCKSCGFEVVDYEVNEEGICKDCIEVK